MKPTTPPTLDQLRAQNAWSCVKDRVSTEYVSQAKALPALIMNSGLLQVLAFLQQKGETGVHATLSRQLRVWLVARFPELRSSQSAADPGYAHVMERMLQAGPVALRRYTAETLDWLQWLRQLAAASEDPQAGGGRP